MNRVVLATIIAVLSFVSHSTLFAQPDDRPNVLFIAVDDLRPELGCYGNTSIKSPNIDRLAEQAVIFKRAYCQQPICMASRASLMSGVRPDSHEIYNCGSLQDLLPDVLTINRHFENNGYRIWAAGKVYHHAEDRRAQFGKNWFEPDVDTVGRGYLSEEAVRTVETYAAVFRETRKADPGGRGPAFEAPDVADNAYHDGEMAEIAIEALAEFADCDEPFFMAVGFKKPHLPFNAPKKYWDLYQEAEIEPASNQDDTAGASQYLLGYNFEELRNYAGIPKKREAFSEALSRALKHGYYACVSYVDAQIGKLLNELRRSGLDDNTIVILWGDHGWKLGEHRMWCKHTPYDIDNHVPLIIKVPTALGHPAKSDALVEFVDIYPSLCELAGLELPGHLEGTSFASLLNRPNQQWKEGAISIWRLKGSDPKKRIMGYTLQTKRYRYTEWIQDSNDKLLATDLFDHKSDPDENVNIANDADRAGLIADLSDLLDRGKGWKKIGNRLGRNKE